MDTMEKTENAVREPTEGAITGSERMNGERRTYIPPVDIVDGESETILILDVPGVSREGVDITVEKGVMTVKAKPAEKVPGGDKLVYSEYRVGSYQRSFSLSEEIDQEHIAASVKDGVLRITLPKSAPVTKKITVSAS